MRFDNILFAPKPVAQAASALWIGGESAVGAQAHGARGRWLVSGLQQSAAPPRYTGAARRGVAELRRVSEAAGRDPETIDVGYLVLWPVDWTAQKTADGARRLFTGSSADMAADATALERRRRAPRGLTFQTATVAETLARMQRFAGEVMPLAR